MKSIFYYMLILLVAYVLFANISSSQTTSIYDWGSNQTIKYTSQPIPIIPTIFNLSLNGSYLYKTQEQYYLNSSIYQNSTSNTEFALAKNAYPFPFIQNMIKDKVPYCIENTLPENEQNNLTIDFFFSLCNVERNTNSSLNNISQNSSISANQIKELAQDFMPTDNFTKELYHLYYQYSSICKEPNAQVSNSTIFIDSYCSGTANNISIPNPVDYSKFYQSLYDYMQANQNNNQIEYLELKYDVNNGTIFPKIYNAQPIQSYSTIAGIYPGILPSGIEATNMAYNSTLILPIKTLNKTQSIILGLNGMNITSGIYSNVTLFAGVQEVNNSYATYNVSTNQSPFQGNESSGYETYQNSCQTTPGLSSVEASEENQIKSNIFSNLYSNNLYPVNYNNKYGNYDENYQYLYTGPSVIQATLSNESIGNTTITYGVLNPFTKQITFEKNISENLFSSSTKIIPLLIPKSAFKLDKMAIFLNTSSPVSYQMNYYEFRENTYSPQYNFSHYTYQEQKIKTEKEKIDNTTITIQVPYFVTCQVQQVSTSIRYNATKVLLEKKYNNYNIHNNQQINVSTNLSISKILNKNQTNLNYSYTYYNVNTTLTNNNSTSNEYTKITLPLMSSFELFSPNDSLIYSFDSYQFDYNLITSNFTNKLTSISKYIYAYDPSYVYPNTYASIPSLYPTIENSYTNTQYLIGISQLEANQKNSLLLDPLPIIILKGFSAVFSNLISSPTKTSYSESVAINNIKEYKYYASGCGGGKIGNNCIINQNYYSYGENASSKAIYHNYDLLNPSIYTQDSFYAGEESPSWLCLKSSVFSYNFLYVLSCANPIVDNLSNIYVTTNYLNFNTSYGNMTPQEKQEFYNDLENATTNTSKNNVFYDEYSYIHAPTYTSQYVNYVTGSSQNKTIGKETYNSNGTITISFSKAFPSIEIVGCDYQVCFKEELPPTNATVNGFYSYTPINNTAYLYSVEPYSLRISNVTINQQINITAGNKTATFNVGKYFILNYINKNASNVFYEKNITINGVNVKLINIDYLSNYYSSLTISPKVIITFDNNTIYNKPIKYVFNKNTEVLYFVNYAKNIIFYILIAIIIFGILYYIGVFNEIATGIKARIEKYKSENF